MTIAAWPGWLLTRPGSPQRDYRSAKERRALAPGALPNSPEPQCPAPCRPPGHLGLSLCALRFPVRGRPLGDELEFVEIGRRRSSRCCDEMPGKNISVGGRAERSPRSSAATPTRSPPAIACGPRRRDFWTPRELSDLQDEIGLHRVPGAQVNRTGDPCAGDSGPQYVLTGDLSNQREVAERAAATGGLTGCDSSTGVKQRYRPRVRYLAAPRCGPPATLQSAMHAPAPRPAKRRGGAAARQQRRHPRRDHRAQLSPPARHFNQATLRRLSRHRSQHDSQPLDPQPPGRPVQQRTHRQPA